jgi:hypothetical protein
MICDGGFGWWLNFITGVILYTRGLHPPMSADWCLKTGRCGAVDVGVEVLLYMWVSYMCWLVSLVSVLGAGLWRTFNIGA